MGRHRRTDVLQGNTMEQYTTVVPTPQRATWLGGSDKGQSRLMPAEELSQAEILAAIQGSRVALEGKIETVAVEVNLLRADLRKVSDKVRVAEFTIMELQMEMGTVPLGRPAGASGGAERASRADGPNWQTREGGLTEDTMTQGSVEDPALRIEILQDGTMAVAPSGSVDGFGERLELYSLLASAQD
ncbi:hypothetical protein NDU88_003342 [Pleurodeles waltl]|uniref:Uncharacterized protein n=1 Tax=Pleurodeles waltl TaxID=8319 RepID=A0AAV7W244_PLEWA|nr:hypothetical protein NDU88_003342 [Pleurodeles waltl]